MNVQLTIVRGGMREFARTGIYPEYLQFFFPENQKRWRVKLHHEVQSGFLRIKGEIHFEYQYIHGECKIRAWNKDYLTLPDFEQIDYVMAMVVD